MSRRDKKPLAKRGPGGERSKAPRGKGGPSKSAPAKGAAPKAAASKAAVRRSARPAASAAIAR